MYKGKDGAKRCKYTTNGKDKDKISNQKMYTASHALKIRTWNSLGISVGKKVMMK